MNKDTGSTGQQNGISRHLTVVVPAFNEQDGIVPTLRSLQETLPGAEIIVVDDCSNDQTGRRAEELGAKVVRHEFNRGYGGALKTGMKHATRRYVAWFDADNEHRAEDLLAMAHRLDGESLVAVVASRRRPGRSTLRVLGKYIIRLIARMLGVEMGPDINCGLRVFRRRAILPYLGLLPDGYSASLTSTMIMIERRYPFSFHPIDVNPRIGHSKIRLSDGFSALTLVARMVMLFAPLRIFFRSGVFLSGVGLIYGIAVALTVGLGIPSSAVLVMVAGILFCSLGLIADQISQLRLDQLVMVNAEAEESPIESKDDGRSR